MNHKELALFSLGAKAFKALEAEILADYQAKLLAEVEMPKAQWLGDIPGFLPRQLQAAAAQAREKALNEAMEVCVAAKSTIWDYHGETQKQIGRTVCDNLAAAIEKLKGGE